jgi:hypothetical protein
MPLIGRSATQPSAESGAVPNIHVGALMFVIRQRVSSARSSDAYST